MKVAVSSSGTNLDSQIDPRFGRCAHFVIVNTDDMSFEAFDNEGMALGGGAGIQSSQFVASKGAGAIITGNIGPNAVQTLSATGVEIFMGQTGSVGEAVERYRRGEIKPEGSPNVTDHYGMGGGTSGKGRGMGKGMGASGLIPPNSSKTVSLSGREELKQLKDYANDLLSQMKALQARIRDLEKK